MMYNILIFSLAFFGIIKFSGWHIYIILWMFWHLLIRKIWQPWVVFTLRNLSLSDTASVSAVSAFMQ